MRRFVSWYDIGEWMDRSGPDIKTMSVFVEETDPVDTGLVDQYGVKIYSVPDRVPIGFRKK